MAGCGQFDAGPLCGRPLALAQRAFELLQFRHMVQELSATAEFEAELAVATIRYF